MAAIYMMGYDAWGDGEAVASYLDRCRRSPKYQKGCWYVLDIDQQPVSSLLVHDFQDWGGLPARGIGSIATNPDNRRKGHGHRIVELAIDALSMEEQVRIFILYSDINPRFYENMGFVVAPQQYQKTSGSTLMLKTLPEFGKALIEENKHRIPSYF